MEAELYPIPGRPEILFAEPIHQSPQRDVWYVETEDIASPEITNHLSALYFEVAKGSGWIATSGMVAYVHPGSHVQIERGQKFRYGGSMDMFVESTPPTQANFVTQGAQKLGRKERKVVKKVRQAERAERMTRLLIDKYGPAVDMMMRLDAERLTHS